MHKLTLLAAAGAVALSGCDFSGTVAPFETPSSIDSIEVSNLRPIFGGENWDPDGNPDVFVEIRSASGRTFFRSETVTDADVSETLVFDVEDALVASPTMQLFVTVFDMDGDLIDAQEMASSPAFTAEQVAAGTLELGDQGRGSAAQIVVRSENEAGDV